MALRRNQKIADITPIAASARGSVPFQGAGTVYGVDLRCLDSSGAEITRQQIRDEITDVTVQVNGQSIVDDIPANTLLNIHDYYMAAKGGGSQVAGILPLVFAHDHMSLDVHASEFAIGMRGVTSGSIQTKLPGSIPNLAQIEVVVEQTAEDRAYGRAIPFVDKFPVTHSSAGIQQWTDYPVEIDRALQALCIEYDGTAATLNSAKVRINGTEYLDLDASIAQQKAEKAGRTWQVSGAADDLFVIDFGLSNDLSGQLLHQGPNGSVRDLRLELEWSAAPGAYTIYRKSVAGIATPVAR